MNNQERLNKLLEESNGYVDISLLKQACRNNKEENVGRYIGISRLALPDLIIQKVSSQTYPDYNGYLVLDKDMNKGFELGVGDLSNDEKFVEDIKLLMSDPESSDNFKVDAIKELIKELE